MSGARSDKSHLRTERSEESRFRATEAEHGSPKLRSFLERGFILTKGIDVSSWQEEIDFKKVKKSGIKFVIIRAGFGTRTEPDKYFERNYRGARDAGLHVGAYWYSYAESGAQALEEARACLRVIAGKKFDFPIFYDIEEQSQFARGIDFCSNLVRIFCTGLEDSVCFGGLYTSR